jgi:AcrR family transcriptional regulator
MPTRKIQKQPEKQGLLRREPRQARSIYKKELIFEAALQLLNEGDLASVTTNAVAQRAGVSIGTLYQYFSDKHELLDSLVQRHTESLRMRIKTSMKSTVPKVPGDRVRTLVETMLGSYGARNKVHRKLMEHSLSRKVGNRMHPVYAEMIDMLSGEGVRDAHNRHMKLSVAEAFVLTHAFAGVLRSLITSSGGLPPRKDIEDALVKLVTGFVNAVPIH